MICRACLRAGTRLDASLHPRSSMFGSLRQTAMRKQPLSSIAVPFYPRRSHSAMLASPRQIQSPSIQIRKLSSSQSHLSSPAPTSTPINATIPGVPEKPDFLSEGESQVWDILVAEFAPTELVVQDISGGCGSMYGIEISSEKFRGLNMLKQQRLVNAALGDLVKEWHGVQLKTKIP